jgi:hypothetical protein
MTNKISYIRFKQTPNYSGIDGDEKSDKVPSSKIQ